MAVDKERRFTPINIALLTVSDTRGPDEDTSGDILAARIASAGHTLAARTILKDDAELIARQFEQWIDDLAIAAFTGCSPLRDLPDELYQTPKGGWSNFNMNYKLPD